jgi:hypothetical protein
MSGVSYLESFRTSSPSTCNEALGVFASRTKWLSQCGQYSSLPVVSPLPRQICVAYIRVLEFARIFAEGLLALFAYEDHVKRLRERVVALLLVTFCAVEPFLAYAFSVFIAHMSGMGRHTAWRADRDLGVENVSAAQLSANRRRSCGGASEAAGGSACLPHGWCR